MNRRSITAPYRPKIPTLITACVGMLSMLFTAPAMAEVFVDDPLTAAPVGVAPGVTTGRQGGRTGPEGWTITGAEDTTWYRIPASLPRGRIEITVTGLSTATNLTGELHDLMVIYGATDEAEPVRYAPFFRSNDFKVQIRIIGTGEPSRGKDADASSAHLSPTGLP